MLFGVNEGTSEAMREPRAILAVAWIAGAMASGAHAQVASPQAIEIPPWFVETFLDFREDIGCSA